jgi:SAM-dependent methyltransferase
MADDVLDSALKKISRMANIEQLSQKKTGMADVFGMYTEDEGIFRRVYSWAGSIHIALSEDGRYHPDGCYIQPRMIEKAIRENGARRVLELCSGNGFNAIYLAKGNPQVQFDAIDLLLGHIKQSRRKSGSLTNICWQVGNVEKLDYPCETFDLVYVVESLVHVPDSQNALAEAYRVLKPGGQMVNFDYFLIREIEELEPNQRNAVRIDQNCSALLGLMPVSRFEEAAKGAGFRVGLVEELSQMALPDIRRLNRLVGLVFAIPWLTKMIVRALPAGAKEGIIDWEILLPLFEAGLMGYYQIVLERP